MSFACATASSSSGAGISIDDLCAAHALKPEDLINAPDVTDSSKVTDRLVGRELVWIEGDLRVTGQARLFGTRLELRDAAGAEAGDAPLYARRAVSPNNLLSGQDFQVVIGEQPAASTGSPSAPPRTMATSPSAS